MPEQTTIDMADVCELAHKLTSEECDRLGIQLRDDVEEYTERVQEIYDRFYELITETLGV